MCPPLEFKALMLLEPYVIDIYLGHLSFTVINCMQKYGEVSPIAYVRIAMPSQKNNFCILFSR